MRLAARVLNRLAAVILSFLTLLRFSCPEEGSPQSFLGAPSLRQQRLLDYRFTISEHCHRISQAYPNEGGLPSYRAALENLNDFSSNVSGSLVGDNGCEAVTATCLLLHGHRIKFAVTLTGFRMDRVTYAQHPDSLIRPPFAMLVGTHTNQLPS